MLFARRPSSRTYRFILRVVGRGLPPVDKVLRVHCALGAADHSIVGVTAVAVHLGTHADCEHVLELLHESPASAAPPKYYEVTAFVAPNGRPGQRIASGGDGDGTEHRIAGLVEGAVTREAILLTASARTDDRAPGSEPTEG